MRQQDVPQHALQPRHHAHPPDTRRLMPEQGERETEALAKTTEEGLCVR